MPVEGRGQAASSAESLGCRHQGPGRPRLQMTKWEGGNVMSERDRDTEIHLGITEATHTGARGPNTASGFSATYPGC